MNVNKTTNTDGTALVGYIDISYTELVRKLGKPNLESGDGKSTAGWGFTVNGIVITIYNYKSSTPPTAERDWHIGGKNGEITLMIVQRMFPKAKVTGRGY